MTDAPGLGAMGAAYLLGLASRAAAEGRERKDPILLLAAARIERLFDIPEVPPPRVALRALREGRAVQGDGRNGLLGFEALLRAASDAAGHEALLVQAEVARLRRLPPPGPSGLKRWQARIPGRSAHEVVLEAPPGRAVDLVMAWDGQGGGRLAAGPATGGTLLGQEARDGCAIIGLTADSARLRVEITNHSASASDYQLVMDGR